MLSMKEICECKNNTIFFNLSNISYNRRSEDKMRLIKLKEINKKELNKIRLFKTIH